MENQPGRVLVTGASGFLGRALVRRLVGDGVETIATARREWPSGPAGLSWRTGDLVDSTFVDELFRDVRPDVVYHLASRVTGSRSMDVVVPIVADVVTASVNVLKAATDVGCRHVVLIGSGDEPENCAAPCSPYAAAKWAVGGYARMFLSLYGTPVAIARPFMVYGPDQPDVTKIVPYTVLAIRRGEPPVITSGRRLCDWVYIDDVVGGLLAVARAPRAVGQRIDLGTGILLPVRHVVERICELAGTSVQPVFGGMPDRPGETEAVADPEQTRRLCGWTPSTDLDTGLARTLAWYQ
jgi:UDP-glucose 4-epimerase